MDARGRDAAADGVDQNGVAQFGQADIMEQMPRGERLDRKGRRHIEPHPGWDRDQAFDRRHAMIGEAARLLQEGLDAVADLGAVDARSERCNLACDLEAADDRVALRMRVKSTLIKILAGFHAPDRCGPSASTRRLVIEEGGFLYDSDSHADELPHYVMAEGRFQLVVPYTLTNNVVKWAATNLATGEDFFTILREAFDFLYEEGSEAPINDECGVQMRLLGIPAERAALRVSSTM